jgi:hypothetical protein
LVLLLGQKLIKLRLLSRRAAENNTHVLHGHRGGNGPAIQMGPRARHKRATQLDGTSVVDWTHDTALEGLLCDR